MNKTNKLLFPDALYDLNTISCASFLYFEKGQIGITLQPTVSKFLSGCDPYDFCTFVQDKNPSWRNSYFLLYKLWTDSNSRIQKTGKLMQPLLTQKAYKSVLLAYPKTEQLLIKAEEFISSLGISYEELFNLINIDQASQELMAHIHFEKILEIYGSQSEESSFKFVRRDLDYKLLFDYCDNLFKNTTIEKVLVKAYFFRLLSIDKIDNFMLSNERLIPLLSKLSNKEIVEEAKQEAIINDDTLDVVSWEVFRQIVSPYLDEKENYIRVNITSDFLQTRDEEIKRLRNKCWTLAENLKSDYNLTSLKQNVSKYVATHVEKDVQNLLSLDKNSFGEIRDKIFSDEKTWLGLLTFITSIFSGGELITAGAGLATLSNTLAKTYEVKSGINKEVKKSDYALLYRIKKT